MENIVAFVSEYGVWAAIFVVIVLIIGAVSLSIGFDFNKWQERRDEARKSKLRALCPHTLIEVDIRDNSVSAESFFHSPSMSPYWICNRCGTKTSDSRVPTESAEFWASNPVKWLERSKRFEKHARKMGLI